MSNKKRYQIGMRQSLCAEITVEATLIISLINIILISVIILAMMYHDRCVIREITESILYLDEGQTKTEAELGEKIINASKGKLLMSDVTRVDAGIGISDVAVEVFMSNAFIEKFFDVSFTTSSKVRIYKLRGAGVVRLFTVVTDTIYDMGL